MNSSFISGTMLEMSWVEIRDKAKKGAVVLFPIAVVEEHGPHMSVAVDIFMSYLMAREAQKHLSAADVDTVIAPPFYWGVNGTTKKFPGSFYVSMDIVEKMLLDIYLSLKNWGFRKIISIPGHGEPDHLRAIDAALKTVYEISGEGAFMVVPSLMAGNTGLQNSPHCVIVDIPDLAGSDPDALMDTHAGMVETSMMLQYFPDHVDHDLYCTLEPTGVTAADYPLWEEGGEYFDRTSPLGYLGSPALADPGLGKALIEAIMEKSIQSIIDRLK